MKRSSELLRGELLERFADRARSREDLEEIVTAVAEEAAQIVERAYEETELEHPPARGHRRGDPVLPHHPGRRGTARARGAHLAVP
jgi:hypothetical protein